MLFFATRVGRTSLPDWDVIVLGAGMAGSLLGFGGMVIELMRTLGMYGIHTARTYLDIHPGAHLTILESGSVVGGTWSSSNQRISRGPSSSS